MTIASPERSFTQSAPLGAFVFHPAARVQASFLSASERDFLDFLCTRMPSWVTPDALTALGVFGAILTAAGYIGTNVSPWFLALASVGLVVNWFGDSLDGSLARHRRIERPQLGFFLDHSMDAVSNLIIAVGLGLSAYVCMGAALFTLVGYLLLGLSVFLSTHVSGKLRLSFLGFGPTELRVTMIAFNIALFIIGPCNLRLIGQDISLHSVSVALLGSILVGLFLFNVCRTTSELSRRA